VTEIVPVMLPQVNVRIPTASSAPGPRALRRERVANAPEPFPVSETATS